MLLILAFRKLRQEDCYVFKIGVDYRVSIKSPKAIERHSYGQQEGFLLQISSLTFVPFHFLMTAFLTPARETSRWFVWVLVGLLAGEMFIIHLHFFSSEFSSELWLIVVMSCFMTLLFLVACTS